MNTTSDSPANRGAIVRQRVDARRDDWIGLWRRLVDTDSGPGELPGIHANYDLLEGPMADLGMVTERVATPGPDVLIARRPGVVARPIRVLLIGHLDTVFPAPEAVERPFTITDGIARGPGVADMKGGIVLALAALDALDESVRDQLSITFLCNGDEESASVDSRAVIEAEGRSADLALVFESGRAGGDIVSARRGAVRMRLDVAGVAAHSGVEPEAGANAAEAAAHHILAAQEFGRGLDDASLTVTIVDAGHLPNIVPDAATVHLDGRFGTDPAGASIVDFVQSLQRRDDVERTSTNAVTLNERPAFPDDGNNTTLVQRYLDAARELGVPAGTQSTGGSSDGNFVAALGVPTIDGLGPIGGGYHRPDEWSDVESLIDRAALLTRLLESVAAEGVGAPTALTAGE